jgi:hypothetical protein
MEDNNYPGIFIASDKASKDAQKTYLRLLAFDLILMVISAASFAYNFKCLECKSSRYFLVVTIMVTSLIFSVVLLTKKFENVWYQGRALAESCKTLVWRFMMCAELFEKELKSHQAKERFVEKINELGKQFTDLNKAMDADLLRTGAISDYMIEVRNMDLENRKKFYLEERIKDQINWYSNKATINGKLYNRWYGIIIACKSLAIITSLFLVKFPNSPICLIGIFTTVSAGVTGWLQTKKHQELKLAYTTAAHELNMIVPLADSIASDQAFSQFVLDSENAISREHTLWLAQRRK